MGVRREASHGESASDAAKWERAASKSRGEVLKLEDPRHDVLAQLRSCVDLDAVLGIDTPVRLVARLFGSNASRSLIEPLGDAIMRDLVAGRNRFSSVAFASATSELLDPGRLATVLTWEDEGFDLMPDESPTDVADDLRTVVGHYVDPKRRLALLHAVWRDTVEVNRFALRAEEFLATAKREAALVVAKARVSIEEAFESAARTMPRRPCAAMFVEWHIQEYLQAQAAMMRYAAAGRAVDIELPSWMGKTVRPTVSAKKLSKAATDLLIATARVRASVDFLRTALPAETRLLGEATRQVPQLRRAVFLDSLPGRVDTLLRFAAGNAESDRIFGQWNSDGGVFVGALASLSLGLGDDHVIVRPQPSPTVIGAVAQLAQLVRFGASLPEKPTSWESLVLRTCAPYFAHPALAIDSPAWVRGLHGLGLPGTDLVVRVPNDMAELTKWADHMGNCIKSIYGDDVSEGTRNILGLFREDELVYNVGVMSNSRRIWEINSRFNAGDVPSEVHSAMQNIITRARHAEDDEVERTRASKTRGRRRVRKFTVAQRTESRVIAEDLRADGQRTDGLVEDGNTACSDLLRFMNMAPFVDRSHRSGWAQSFAALRRAGDDAVGRAFREGAERGQVRFAWAMIATHPLDRWLDGETTRRHAIDAEIASALELIRNGDDRAQLGQSSVLLDDPTFEALWVFARLQTVLRREVLSMLSSPMSLRSLCHSDETGVARQTLALLYLMAGDQGLTSNHRTPVVPLDLVESQRARVWLLADRFDNAGVRALLDALGFASLEEATMANLVARRVERGLPLAQCPRTWFGRRGQRD